MSTAVINPQLGQQKTILVKGLDLYFLVRTSLEVLILYSNLIGLFCLSGQTAAFLDVFIVRASTIIPKQFLQRLPRTIN
jgi:hypothetical protein